MIIEKDRVVAVSYELRTSAEGEIVEKTEAGSPLTFLFGHKNMLQKFEENLNGKKSGDKFNFKLECKDAYGFASDDNLVEIPKSAFVINGKLDEDMLRIGNSIPMQDNNGNRFTGIVKEINEDIVIMDFNHPMVGMDLYFQGEVISVREATQDEIQHGHIHHECHGCGKH